MADCPFDTNIHVKRKVEPAEGLSWWFADVPEGGVNEDTYLCLCAPPHSPLSDRQGCSINPRINLGPAFYSAVSEETSNFQVQPHFHPKSTENFTILEGKVHFELDGKTCVVEKGENFVIPRGVVHKVWSPEGERVKFKVRGDQDIVEERDFLMKMFTLVETVSMQGFYFARPSWALTVPIAAFRTSLDC